MKSWHQKFVQSLDHPLEVQIMKDLGQSVRASFHIIYLTQYLGKVKLRKRTQITEQSGTEEDLEIATKEKVKKKLKRVKEKPVEYSDCLIFPEYNDAGAFYDLLYRVWSSWLGWKVAKQCIGKIHYKKSVERKHRLFINGFRSCSTSQDYTKLWKNNDLKTAKIPKKLKSWFISKNYDFHQQDKETKVEELSVHFCKLYITSLGVFQYQKECIVSEVVINQAAENLKKELNNYANELQEYMEKKEESWSKQMVNEENSVILGL